MSLINILVPNDEYNIYCNSITANAFNIDDLTVTNLTVTNLNAANINADNVDASDVNAAVVVAPTVNTNSLNSFSTGNINVGNLLKASSGINVDSITEYTSGHGVTINNINFTDTNVIQLPVGNSTAGIILPNTFTSPASNQLTYYSTNNISFSFSGIWATSQTANVSITRIGNQVTLSLLSVISATAVVPNSFINSSTIPSAFLPINTIRVPILVLTAPGGTQADSFGTLIIFTTGLMNMYVGSYGGNITPISYPNPGYNYWPSVSSGPGSGLYPFSVTYLVS
jgi:hypothetical protein